MTFLRVDACFSSFLKILAWQRYLYLHNVGLFWVPGGVATVYAVKSAGLAIGIGIGSSFIVLVSFVWGIFVFDEEIHSRSGACGAILLMIVGLFGMSYYSSPVVNTNDDDDGILTTGSASVVAYQEVAESPRSDDDEGDGIIAAGMPNNGPTQQHQQKHGKITLTDRTARSNFSDSVRSAVSTSDYDDEDRLDAAAATSLPPSAASASDDHNDIDLSLHAHGSDASIQSSHVVMCGGVVITKRHWGMLAAMFCGVWGGSIMAPMKFAPAKAKVRFDCRLLLCGCCRREGLTDLSLLSYVQGAGYLISFAIGASVVTLALWLLRFLYYCKKYQSPVIAYRHLPSFHLRRMWLAGGTCGLLWSIGNFFSLFSVEYLGEGVGYPLVQTSILISGLWGIFYFKEVTGRQRITKWLLSSLSTIAGIILLSYEHHEKRPDDKS